MKISLLICCSLVPQKVHWSQNNLYKFSIESEDRSDLEGTRDAHYFNEGVQGNYGDEDLYSINTVVYRSNGCVCPVKPSAENIPCTLFSIIFLWF